MKKICKVLLSCFFALALFSALGISSFAATQPQPSDISVMVGEKLLVFNDVKPVEVNGRVFVPLRAFFEQLGAKVIYEDASKSITCTRYDTTVKLTVGSKIMTVTGKTGTVTTRMDVAPYIQGDYVMIPARYAASALGCQIGWSSKERTVLILDVDGMIKSSGAHYTLINKLLNVNKPKTSAYAIDGSLNMSMDLGTGAPVKITGSFTGLSGKDAINLNAKLDLSSVAKAYVDSDSLSADDILIINMLKNFNLDCIFDYSSLTMYFKSPILSLSAGIESDAWIAIPFGRALLPGSFSDIMNCTSFEDYLRISLNSTYLYDQASLKRTIANFNQTNAFCSDEAFSKDENTYTNYKSASKDGTMPEFMLQLTVVGDDISSFCLNVGDKTTKITYSMDSAKNITLSLKSKNASDSGLNIDMVLKMKLTETSKKPVTKPDGKIYDQDDLNKSVIGTM